MEKNTEAHESIAAVTEACGRTADAWWAWHDADAERWSASTAEGEARCAEWVAGKSDDGPR